jgi:uncharacterized protein
MSQSPTHSQRIAFLLLGASLALGFIIGLDRLGNSLLQLRSRSPSIVVKGLATQNIKSNQAIIEYQISWRGTDSVVGRKNFSAQRDLFQKKLIEYGFDEKELNTHRVVNNRLEPANAKTTGAIEYDKYARGTVPDFIYFQNITITSNKIELVDKISRDEFILENDVEVSRTDLAFKLINFDDSKKELLETAGKNARSRADILVSGSGSKIGNLISAAQGVFQVQAKDAIAENTDYNSFDTSSIDKTIRVVVTMTYEIVKE